MKRCCRQRAGADRAPRPVIGNVILVSCEAASSLVARRARAACYAPHEVSRGPLFFTQCVGADRHANAATARIKVDAMRGALAAILFTAQIR